MTNKRKWQIAIIVLVFALLLWSTLFLNYETMNAKDVLSPPSSSHWFGTDDFGRDIFIRVFVGARYSIVAALFIVGLAYFGGILLGTGGLVRSYSEATNKAILENNLLEMEMGYEMEITLDYKNFEIFKYYC